MEEFKFRVKLNDGNGTPGLTLTGDVPRISWKRENDSTSHNVENAVFWVTTSEQNPAVISGIPVGTRYEIEEFVSESNLTAKETSSFNLASASQAGTITVDEQGSVVDRVTASGTQKRIRESLMRCIPKTMRIHNSISVSVLNRLDLSLGAIMRFFR